MFKQLDQSKDVHTIYASKNVESTTVAKKGDVKGTDIKIGVTGNETTNMTQVAHEGGHAWRIQNGFDTALPSIDPLNPTFSSVLNYNNAREAGERGAGHIENIITGELIQGGRNVPLQSTYSLLGPTYNFNSGNGKPGISWGWRDLDLLNGPYYSEGYLKGEYKLGDIQR